MLYYKELHNARMEVNIEVIYNPTTVRILKFLYLKHVEPVDFVQKEQNHENR